MSIGQNKIEELKRIDYKKVDVLRKYLDASAKIQKKRKSKVPSLYQRKLSQEIKRARFLGLLPYIAK